MTTQDMINTLFNNLTNKEKIITLFNNLTNEEKVETLTALYFTLRAAQKDRFLEETGNA